MNHKHKLARIMQDICGVICFHYQLSEITTVDNYYVGFIDGFTEIY